MLSFILKSGIFTHFKHFLTNKYILNTLVSQTYINFTIVWLLSHQITPPTFKLWFDEETLIRFQHARLNISIPSRQLHGRTKLIFTGRIRFCYMNLLSFLCNIHCTVLFSAIKWQFSNDKLWHFPCHYIYLCRIEFRRWLLGAPLQAIKTGRVVLRHAPQAKCLVIKMW